VTHAGAYAFGFLTRNATEHKENAIMSEIMEKQQVETPVSESTRNVAKYTPRFDILETDDELVLYGDLPGVAAEDLDVQYENRELTIYGRVAPRMPEARNIYCEYGVGDFQRSFAIGEVLDASQIHAELKHGVLTIHLPKTEAVKLRRIPVQAGE
jgi:HSP20 family protein